MRSLTRKMPDLEIAMLRRSVGQIGAAQERCAQCHRAPLIGERVHVCAHGRLLCELCRAQKRAEPLESRVVRSPEFGHAVRILITDRREAAA